MPTVSDYKLGTNEIVASISHAVAVRRIETAIRDNAERRIARLRKAAFYQAPVCTCVGACVCRWAGTYVSPKPVADFPVPDQWWTYW
jgi:hypothetical protein